MIIISKCKRAKMRVVSILCLMILTINVHGKGLDTVYYKATNLFFDSELLVNIPQKSFLRKLWKPFEVDSEKIKEGEVFRVVYNSNKPLNIASYGGLFYFFYLPEGDGITSIHFSYEADRCILTAKSNGKDSWFKWNDFLVAYKAQISFSRKTSPVYQRIKRSDGNDGNSFSFQKNNFTNQARVTLLDNEDVVLGYVDLKNEGGNSFEAFYNGYNEPINNQNGTHKIVTEIVKDEMHQKSRGYIRTLYTYCVNKEGQIIPSYSDTVTKEVNRRGYEIRNVIIDTSFRFPNREEMYPGHTFTYDDNNNLIEVKNIGGSLSWTSAFGSHPIERYRYNEKGYIVSESYHDSLGNLTILKQPYVDYIVYDYKFCEIRYEYDSTFNRTKKSYHGLNGEPVVMDASYGAYSFHTIVYDTKGRPIELSRYDTAGRPVVYEGEFYTCIFRVSDENDIENVCLIAIGDEFNYNHKTVFSYNKMGMVKTITFFDHVNNPILFSDNGADGVCMIEILKNKFGLTSGDKYYDENGEVLVEYHLPQKYE